ncbi:MAG: type I-E CRISPR-associated protein Cas5/CasD [Bacteroidales bacterium]|nr:type I-E CRISPR-associated protein Cas5/CasD [Bacteroidales bacterium]
MSNDMTSLAMRLEGPMQSWGFDSQFNRRNTGLIPTKSGIAGMICAALGYTRGGDKENSFLLEYNSLKMTAIAIPRVMKRYFDNKEYDLEVRRIIDYHTVEGTVRASGSSNANAVITYRQYLNDASFGIVLTGDNKLLNEIGDALKNPVWGIWLGRKNCIPTAPVFAGFFNDANSAYKSFLGERKGTFIIRSDADNFTSGTDSLPDNVVCFESINRKFVPRRIINSTIIIE